MSQAQQTDIPVTAGKRSSDPDFIVSHDYVFLPGLVEPHAHLDKALTSDLVANVRGDLRGAIEAWLPFRAARTTEAIQATARAAVLRYLANGTTLIRTHVDTGSDIGLRAVEAILAVREEFRSIVDIQVVAAVPLAIAGPAGAAGRELIQAAVAEGADLVGGAPWLEDLPTAAIDTLLDLAAGLGVGVDLHLDETIDPTVLTLPILIERVRAGFPGSVTASHCVSLGQQPRAVRQQIAHDLVETGIGIVTNPLTNLYLQGRDHRRPVTRGLTAVRDLLDAGVALAAGGDNLRDPFNPLGRADPLDTAGLLIAAGHATTAEAVESVTAGARRVLGVGPADVDRGDAVAVRATTVDEAIAYAPAGRIVFRDGRVVARTETTTTFTDHVEHRHAAVRREDPR